MSDSHYRKHAVVLHFDDREWSQIEEWMRARKMWAMSRGAPYSSPEPDAYEIASRIEVSLLEQVALQQAADLESFRRKARLWFILAKRSPIAAGQEQ